MRDRKKKKSNPKSQAVFYEQNSFVTNDIEIEGESRYSLWRKFQDNSIMVSGATGLIGSFLCDVIMLKNQEGLNCQVYALGRTEAKAHDRFAYCWGNPLFHYVKYDVNESLKIDQIQKIGYVLHLASNTHPMAYSTDPIGTITANVIGLKNMLNFCVEHNADRFAFASSNEIYGENRGDGRKG